MSTRTRTAIWFGEKLPLELESLAFEGRLTKSGPKNKIRKWRTLNGTSYYDCCCGKANLGNSYN